jgi:hypothetical protein
MRDLKITVTKIDDIIITLARTAPLTSKIIVKGNNGSIETLSALKQRQSGLLDVDPTIPRISPEVPNY